MRSSKSRSRNKSNRQRSIGNVVNRVFDSNGPEGKVRGTPQQIIEKYLTLARDAQLSNDRVAEQNFLQHAEHYTRMLGEAQRELAREQEERQRQNQNNSQNGNQGNGQNGGQNGGRERADPPREGDAPAQLPEAAGTEDEGSTLVETPEARSTAEEPAAEAQDKPKREKSPRSRRGPRKPKEAAGEAGGAAEAPAAAASDTPAEGA